MTTPTAIAVILLACLLVAFLLGLGAGWKLHEQHRDAKGRFMK